MHPRSIVLALNKPLDAEYILLSADHATAPSAEYECSWASQCG